MGQKGIILAYAIWNKELISRWIEFMIISQYVKMIMVQAEPWIWLGIMVFKIDLKLCKKILVQNRNYALKVSISILFPFQLRLELAVPIRSQ